MEYTPLVEYCVKRLVDEPDEVKVEQVKDRGAIQIRVQVAPNDIGKVIGRNGRVVNALRHLVTALASKEKQRVYVKVLTD
ncbi:MAG: KH domain-containing protein [Armatimonadetes bacterium]|nr:KH domain-containing protein [Armatimonadota bacterium]